MEENTRVNVEKKDDKSSNTSIVSVKMFKAFKRDDISTSTQVKASVQRGIKSQISKANRSISEEELDVLVPKKTPLVQYKVGPHMMLYCQRIEHDDGSSPSDEPVFFQHRDGPILPTLRVVHKYPSIKFTSVQVDKGAIPYLLGGYVANALLCFCLCPGCMLLFPSLFVLTSLHRNHS